jgi:hypothetical protein
VEPVAVVVPVLIGPPAGEHTAGELQALLAEGLLLGQPVGVAAEVALEMGPAHLALVGIETAKSAILHCEDGGEPITPGQWRPRATR